MNLLIQELAEQAGFYVADGRIYIPSTSEEITTCQKKFAELIVAECMTIGFNTVYKVDDDSAAVAVYQNIKEHFGVEE